MPASPFSVVVQGGPDVVTLVMAGDLGAEADTALDDAYARATASGATVIVLDCSAVQYINSTGIALIVRLLADARRNRREVRAFGLTPHYVEIFQITRISEFVRIFDSPAGALAVGLPATAGGQT
jgi:anti-sigma B factor antagonist